MIDTEAIKLLATEFGACQKILTALGDEVRQHADEIIKRLPKRNGE